MRSTLLLLAALFLAPHQTKAQDPQGVSGLDLGSSRIVFSPTNHAHPNEADMASLLNDRMLQTYLRPIDETTVAPQDGYALYDSNDCDRGVSCLMVTSERGTNTLIFPFASSGSMGPTRIMTLHAADQVRPNASQIEALPRDLQSRLRIEDGIIMIGEGYGLFAASQAATPNCSATACGITIWDFERFTLHSLGSAR